MGASLVVRVSPGSSRPGVCRPDPGQMGMGVELAVRVAQRATDGLANDAVCRALARWADCSPSRVRIRRGHTSRVKRVEFLDLEADALAELVSTCT